jgi:hypothetical protein
MVLQTPAGAGAHRWAFGCRTILLDDPEVKAECGALPRAYVLSYRLGDGPSGDTVHWTLSFDGTVQFSLAEHPSPDIVLVGDWRQLMRASEANRRGEQVDPGVRVEGDPAVLAAVGAAFAKAQSVGTLAVTFDAL